MARRLELSPATLRNHLQAIYIKLKVRRKRDLVMLIERKTRAD
jgi:DNA-binding CsgD family transcriptional regulator